MHENSLLESPLLKPVYKGDHDHFPSAVKDFNQHAVKASFPGKCDDRLRKILKENVHIFLIGLYSTLSPCKIAPQLKTELLPNSRAVRVKVRNYSEAHQKFRKEFVENCKITDT